MRFLMSSLIIFSFVVNIQRAPLRQYFCLIISYFVISKLPLYSTKYPNILLIESHIWTLIENVIWYNRKKI